MLRFFDDVLVARRIARARRSYEDAAPADALAHARAALRRRPGSPEARNMAGVALLALGRAPEAVDEFRRALAARPAYASAHINLGSALAEQGDLATAIEHYSRAVHAEPGSAPAQLGLAMALEDDGRYADARTAYERAHALAPSDGVRIKMATMLPLYPRSAQEIDTLRERLEGDLEALAAGPLRVRDPLREVGQTAFLLPYQGRNDRELQRKLAAVYERACPELLYVAPHCRAKRPRSKLRVGFASKHLTAHSVGIWFNRLFSLVAGEADLDATLIDLGGNADAGLRAACARSIAVPNDLARAREAIAALELDVLLYPDIGMEPLSYFLAFSRLAPVQCAMLGHPVTTGIRNVDYFLSSAWFEAPGAEAHYTERLVALDALPVYIERPALPRQPRTRGELGLPEDRTLYACPMMLHKFHPDFDAAMAGILQADPRAEIVLFRDARHPRRHEGLAARFAAAHGELAGRLRFLPWASFEDLVGIVRAADVVIDTFHFGAGTTAFIVFAAGRPLVTLPGEYVRGRPTLGCLRKMGVQDCVARDPAHYIELAVRFANDRALREAVGERIAGAAAGLFADPAAPRELAAFLRRVA